MNSREYKVEILDQTDSNPACLPSRLLREHFSDPRAAEPTFARDVLILYLAVLNSWNARRFLIVYLGVQGVFSLLDASTETFCRRPSADQWKGKQVQPRSNLI
jgi:hypothetical protein